VLDDFSHTFVGVCGNARESLYRSSERNERCAGMPGVERIAFAFVGAHPTGDSAYPTLVDQRIQAGRLVMVQQTAVIADETSALRPGLVDDTTEQEKASGSERVARKIRDYR
jgi:hypothetical protein